MLIFVVCYYALLIVRFIKKAVLNYTDTAKMKINYGKQQNSIFTMFDYFGFMLE